MAQFTDFKDYYDGVANRVTYLLCFYNDTKKMENIKSEILAYHSKYAYPLAVVSDSNFFQWECQRNPVHRFVNELTYFDKQLYAMIYIAHNYGGLFFGENCFGSNSVEFFEKIEENVHLGIFRMKDISQSTTNMSSLLTTPDSLYECEFLFRRDTELTKELFGKLNNFLDFYEGIQSRPPSSLMLSSIFLETIHMHSADLLFI